MTKGEIQAKYLTLHDTLGSRKDAGDKELFDQQHAQVWNDCSEEIKARKTELKAKDTLTEDERRELGELETIFPTLPPLAERLPTSQHLARIKSIDVSKAKPVTVTRKYAGQEFDINCVVTEDIKEQHLAGKINVGDIVIITYCEERQDQAIVQSKVFKSW